MDTANRGYSDSMPEVRDKEVEVNLCSKATYAIDYRCSWDFWRNACIYYDRYDPGPCEPITEEENTGLISIPDDVKVERLIDVDSIGKEIGILKERMGGVENFLLQKEQRKKSSPRKRREFY